MRLQSALARSLSITITAVALAAGITAPASAASRPVVPNDTQEWGNDKVRVAATQPATMSVGPSGGSMESSDGSGTSSSSLRRGAGAAPADGTTLSVDYCVEIDLADASSGPYRLRFHVDGSGGDSSSSAPGRTAAAAHRRVGRGNRPLTGELTLTFNLSTAADAWVTTTGNSGLAGAIYDADSDLVAGDDDSGRIAVSLAAGDYSLLLTGTDLTGTFTALADQGTCSE